MPSSPDTGYFQKERFLKQWGIKKYTNSNVSNYSQTPWGPGTPQIPGELLFNVKFSKESICVCVCVCVVYALLLQSCLTLCSTMDCQAPLSTGFSRQEHWSG